MPDPRSARGRIYSLSFILAMSLVAVLAGASNFRQIRDQVADMSQSLLRKLGGKWCYFRRLFGGPSERTIRRVLEARVLEAIDATALDRIAGAWLQANARRGTEGERGFDYVLTVKANQPQLWESVFARCLPRLRDTADHIVEERGHGRVSQWQTWVTNAADIDCPHREQVACIRRNIFTTGGSWMSKEHAWIVTSGDADMTTVDGMQ